ncbi:MAG TPA: O-antigen ligase family protein [bacterium]|jgi:O-antigen ligase|nr:O-antigen ligase family protein [bacterium]HOG38146.1 O-antigen ligase family protein [bacterium]
MNDSEKYLKYSIYGLIGLCFISCLLLFDTWIFPFITSKTILFRIFTELLFFAYLILAIKNKEYRPKKSWILYSILIFTGIAIITSLFGINPYLSFKGDLERMWGINTWIHLLMFFVVVTSFFKTGKEWFCLFNFILIFSCVNAVVSSLQINGLIKIIAPGLKMDGLLGNMAYVAGVLLFGILISLYFFVGKKNIGWKIFYGLAFLIQLPIFLRTQIRGANLAFWIVLLILCLVFIFKSKNKRLKIALCAFVILVVSVFTMAFINKDEDWVKNNFVFSKLTTMSFSTGTVRTRLISWNGGFQAFKENPIMGYGMENYYYAFDKYLQADYYNIAASETWFDRAHNMVVETLVCHGIFGMISYLAIFVFTFWALYKVYKKNKEKYFLFCLFFALIIFAYFFQNLFVFDSLAVALIFFSILAYINLVYTNETDKKSIYEKNISETAQQVIIVLFGIVTICFIFGVNMSDRYIAKQNYVIQKTLSQERDFQKAYKEMQKLYENNSYLNKDSTTMLIDTVSNIYTTVNSQDPNQIQALYDILTLLIDKTNYYLSINDKEAYLQINLARLHIIRSNFFAPDSQEKLNELNTAKRVMEKSIELSPERLHNYYFMANIYSMMGDIDSAIKELETALNYNDKYGETYLMLGGLYSYKGDTEKGEEYVQKALELNPSLQNRIKATQ